MELLFFEILAGYGLALLIGGALLLHNAKHPVDVDLVTLQEIAPELFEDA